MQHNAQYNHTHDKDRACIPFRRVQGDDTQYPQVNYMYVKTYCQVVGCSLCPYINCIQTCDVTEYIHPYNFVVYLPYVGNV